MNWRHNGLNRTPEKMKADLKETREKDTGIVMIKSEKYSTKKLSSRSGISMVMAMVAFLVVTMVAMVIVTGALTAAKAVSNDRETQQNMLYLTSAAKILKNQLYDDESYIEYTEYYTIPVTVTIKQLQKRDRNYQWYNNGTANTSSVDGEAILDTSREGTCSAYGVYGVFKFDSAYKSLVENTSLSSVDGKYEISTTLPDGESETVEVNSVMYPSQYYEGEAEITDKPYKVIFTISSDSVESLFVSTYADVSKGDLQKSNLISSEVQSTTTESINSTSRNQITTRIDTYRATRTDIIRWNKNFRFYNILSD